MMSRKNKFGIDPDDGNAPSRPRGRSPGPMAVAIRDTAENLQLATEEKVEQRRRNAADSKTLQSAIEERRLLVSIPLSKISTTDLPRDRLDLEAVASSDEMDELKASITARGQREPVEVYLDDKGIYQLKSGWRRLNALRQLYTETDDDKFGSVVARVTASDDERLVQYIDMAEENIIREDLTFAEMAQLAIAAADDPEIDESDPEAVIARLYKNLHKVKRSYIRSFVHLLVVLEHDLKWPKSVARNIGVEVGRALKSEPERGDQLRKILRACADQDEQNSALHNFISKATPKPSKPRRKAKEKFEFHVEGLKITARRGECRILGGDDYSEIPRERLEKAIIAFHTALQEE